jgi:hypothetical protein
MQAKVIVPLALVFVLLAAVPIQAAPPVVETGELNLEVPAYECPGFDVYDHVVGTLRTTSFYDNDDTLLKVTLKAVGTDNLYNYDNPTGRVLTGHFTSVDTFNGKGDRISTNGTFLSITIPPGGKVVQISGRVDYVRGTFAGVDTASSEAWALICEALAVD